MDYWQLFVGLLSLVCVVESGMVNVCSDLTSCVACTQSYVHIFSFREHCRLALFSFVISWSVICKEAGDFRKNQATFLFKNAFLTDIQGNIVLLSDFPFYYCYLL